MPAARVIFIVDRDLAVRDSLRFSIELDGMDVRTCGSARELLAHPELVEGSCAVIDGKTLDRDGADVVARLQASCDILPIVLIVDHVSRRSLAQAIGSGRFHLVEKPVLDDAVLQSVRAIGRI